jgi:integrase/recombinase XerD
VVTGKGGKVVTIPLAPHGSGIDPAIGERTDGPVIPAVYGRRLDLHGAGRARTCIHHRRTGPAVPR